jgi:cytochrome c oxidase subunit 3
MTSHAGAIVHGREPATMRVGIDRGMAGMALFIGSEVMIFACLFAGYFFVRNQASTWPPVVNGHEVETANAVLALILTVLLVSSSGFAHFGIFSLQNNNRTGFKFGIAVAILLGTIFISGQIYEWFSLFDEGLNAHSTTYGSTFFLITGFHGAHVIAGLCMLWVVLVRAFRNDFTPRRHVFADAAVLYWHFVDVIWIFVVFILYITVSYL